MAAPSKYGFVGGLDFTSRPSARKPIWVAHCQLGMPQQHLHLLELLAFTDWSAFEAYLQAPPVQWLACDFPFSLPYSFLQAMGWPTGWHACMAFLQTLGRTPFEQAITTYMASQPAGHKLHFRPTDRVTQSSSPMKLMYPAVGKMLFEGATRLHQAQPDTVLPFNPYVPNTPIPHTTATYCIEGYPAMVARTLLSALGQPKGKYKDDKPCTPLTATRKQLLNQLTQPDALAQYGIAQLHIPPALQADLLTDVLGDRIDALLCAVQAAWASQHPNGGIPQHAHANQGWIVGPNVMP
jgi:hypothetical protein